MRAALRRHSNYGAENPLSVSERSHSVDEPGCARLSGVPSPLCIGTVTLSDGELVKGFLCESHGLSGGVDITGKRRIPAMLPGGARVAHKTGSLNNTSSDVGIITGPDGRSIAVAIYVTGQGGKPNREAKIATLARALYDGYGSSARQWANARYQSTGSAVAAN